MQNPEDVFELDETIISDVELLRHIIAQQKVAYRSLERRAAVSETKVSIESYVHNNYYIIFH